VALALADKVGVTPLAARVALVALSFFGGLGIAIYVGGWLFLPPEGSDQAIFWDARADHRTVALVAAAASVLGALMVVAGLLGAPALLGSVSPGLVSVAALVAVWRHADRGDRLAVERLVTLLSASGPAASGPAQPSAGRRLVIPLLRLLVGAGLIVLGTSTLLAPKHLNDTDIVVAFAAVGVVAGVSLILAPWWLRLGRELAAERRQRARAEERAEMAAHLHDSVLQTLALIQRNAQDPQQVQRLARAQERQLRSWLFDRSSAEHPPVAGVGPDQPRTLGTAVLAMQQVVEADHGIRVEVVTVGDCDLDEGLRALVAATREAVVNAAKWSGADMVSVYAEVEADSVSVFVRDRGRGFDPERVAADRRGISESIHGRIERHGGMSNVRSSPGQGTEVSLRVPTKAQP
jgi:signal transduction histidine kinase